MPPSPAGEYVIIEQTKQSTVLIYNINNTYDCK